MCSYNDKETLSTLRFGYRAKSIKNKAKVNEEKSAKELLLLLEAANRTIIDLRQQLGGKAPSQSDEMDET
jgi:C-terminal processing protease CtpA/Prc